MKATPLLFGLALFPFASLAQEAAPVENLPATETLYCNWSSLSAMNYVGMATVMIEGGKVKVMTNVGDNFLIMGKKCESAKVEVQVIQDEDGVRYINQEAGLNIKSLNRLVGFSGKVESSIFNGTFKDATTGASCQLYGQFDCHD